jgi:hypothetical protein
MTKHDNQNSFKNFAVLSAQVSEVALKESASGNKYKAAKATLTGITCKDANGNPYHPVIEVLAFKKARKFLRPGHMKLLGSLGYSEWENEDGEAQRQVKLIARSISPMQEGDSPRSFVLLSLRAAKDAESRLSQTSGELWTSVNTSLSMGKDEDGDYRPSLWLTLKAFSRGGDERLPLALGELVKGDHIHAKGGLTCEEYQGRLYWGVFLSDFAYRNFDGAQTVSANDQQESIEEAELEAIPD